MGNQTSPIVHKRQLGMALQSLREAAKLDPKDAATKLECSDAKISRIERGHVSVRPAELRDLLALYKAGATVRRSLEQLGREARKRRPRTSYGTAIPQWFRDYVRLEEGASEIRSYDEGLVTGLLQTPDYTRTLILANPSHDPKEVDRLVEARIARQARLDGEHPPRIWAVGSEQVIRRTIGDRNVMRDQLKHLRALATRPNITFQVIPFNAGAHAASGFNFTLLRFPDSDGLDVAYLEDLTGASIVDRDKPDDLAKYAVAFDHLLACALPPAQTLHLLDTVRQEL